MLIREHDAPEQPLVQREYQQRWAHPARCTAPKELAERLPQWEVWGQDLETARGRPLEEESKVCSLDQLVPEDYRQALDDHLELKTYSERLLFVKRKLGLLKHRALARVASTLPGAEAAMDGSPVEEGCVSDHLRWGSRA